MSILKYSAKEEKRQSLTKIKMTNLTVSRFARSTSLHEHSASEFQSIGRLSFGFKLDIYTLSNIFPFPRMDTEAHDS